MRVMAEIFDSLKDVPGRVARHGRGANKFPLGIVRDRRNFGPSIPAQKAKWLGRKLISANNASVEAHDA